MPLQFDVSLKKDTQRLCVGVYFIKKLVIYSDFRYISRIFPALLSKLISIFIRLLHTFFVGAKPRVRFTQERTVRLLYQYCKKTRLLPEALRQVPNSCLHWIRVKNCMYRINRQLFSRAIELFNKRYAHAQSLFDSRHVFSGSAQDTLDTLKDIDSVHSALGKSVASARIVSSLKNTMSDRHAAEKLFNTMLQDYRVEVLPKIAENWKDLAEPQGTVNQNE